MKQAVIFKGSHHEPCKIHAAGNVAGKYAPPTCRDQNLSAGQQFIESVGHLISFLAAATGTNGRPEYRVIVLRHLIEVKVPDRALC